MCAALGPSDFFFAQHYTNFYADYEKVGWTPQK